MSAHRTARMNHIAFCLPLLLAVVACDSGTTPPPPTTMVKVDSAPRYGVASLIFGDAGSFSYLSVLPSLGVQDTVLLSQAREFPGYAISDAWQGTIVVGSGDQPELTGYTVSDDGLWTGHDTVSFAAYTSMPLDGSVYVTATKAYVPIDVTNHVTWNPATFTLGAAIGAPPQIPLTRGDNDELTVRRGYSHELRGSVLFQPYYWADDSFHAYSQLSQISVIDTTTDTVKTVLDLPCPHMHITSQDDAGNMYFSNGQGSISAAVLTPDSPKDCFARINAGQETIDPTSITYFKDLTGGREGSNIFWIGPGKALFNVYHAERDNITADTMFSTIDYSANYHLWTLDLVTMQAQIMDGIDFGGGQFVAFRIDGRVLVAIPSADYSTTAVYEVLPTGVAQKQFDVEGWAFKIFRVR